MYLHFSLQLLICSSLFSSSEVFRNRCRAPSFRLSEVRDQPQCEVSSGCKARIHWLGKVYTDVINHKTNLGSSASVFVYITVGFHSSEIQTPTARCAGWRTTSQQPLCLRPSRSDPPNHRPTDRLVRMERSVYVPVPAAAAAGEKLGGKKHRVSIDYRGQILSCTQHFQRNGVLKAPGDFTWCTCVLVSGRELNR